VNSKKEEGESWEEKTWRSASFFEVAKHGQDDDHQILMIISLEAHDKRM